MLPALSEIKMKRRQLGLTQSGLALLANVSQSLVAKLESGQIVPSYDKVKRIFDSIEQLQSKSALSAADVMTKKIVFVGPDGKVRDAIKLMESKALSQLPVLLDGRSIGTISEKGVLARLGNLGNADLGRLKVSDVMAESLPLVLESTPVNIINPLLDHSPAVLVSSKGAIVGIVSKSDLLKALLRQDGKQHAGQPMQSPK